MAELKLGFLGSGQMATALAEGFVAAKLIPPEGIIAADPSPEARANFAAASGAKVGEDNAEVLKSATVVFLAVKPQHAPQVLSPLSSAWTKDHLLVSIAAGLTTEFLAKHTSDTPRLIRVMPNTPCLVGYSASAFSLGPRATEADASLVERLLVSVGHAHRLDEALLDAVTGLSGSGPAFVYQIIEALSDGGVRMGLPRAVATALAAQTVRGAAEMVLVTGEHPATLKDRVASPGGTTIAGLQALEQGGLRATLMSAVEAATRRSTELGQST